VLNYIYTFIIFRQKINLSEFFSIRSFTSIYDFNEFKQNYKGVLRRRVKSTETRNFFSEGINALSHKHTLTEKQQNSRYYYFQDQKYYLGLCKFTRESDRHGKYEILNCQIKLTILN